MKTYLLRRGGRAALQPPGVNTTPATMAEWFRDWDRRSRRPRDLWVTYKQEWAALKREPEFAEPRGVV